MSDPVPSSVRRFTHVATFFQPLCSGNTRTAANETVAKASVVVETLWTSEGVQG
jgi:hypothetical protein